jgi:uncharacterized protein YajQ (UPF0234 family)
MPSFDISSEVNKTDLKNAIDAVGKKIIGRHDFKGTSAKVEFNEKDSLLTIWGDSDFQLDQIKAILLPEMGKKEADSAKRLDHQDVQSVSGNKVKQILKIKDGIDTELAKKIVKLLKDGGLKVQASIQGESVRVTGAKRDVLQDAIAFVKKSVTDFPLQFGNFRD